MDQPAQTPAVEFSEREKKFLTRIVNKYGEQEGRPLLRSLLVITLLIVTAHGIERTALPAWAAFCIVYIPSLWLFSRYRKISIFKSRLMRKLAVHSNITEVPTQVKS